MRSLERLRGWFDEHPAAAFLGARCVDLEAGVARLQMPTLDEMRNPNRAIGGDFQAALADLAAGLAVATVTERAGSARLLALHLQYLEPLREGPVLAESRILRRGGSHAFTTIQLSSADGRPSLFGTGAWRLRAESGAPASGAGRAGVGRLEPRLDLRPRTDLAAVAHWYNSVRPGTALVGCLATDLEPGWARVEMRPPGDPRNPDGTVASCFLSAMVDEVAGLAVVTTTAGDEYQATLDLAAHHIQPARELPLVGVAAVRHRGAHHVVSEVEIRDAGGTLCTVGRGTWPIIHGSPHSIGRQAADPA